MKCPYCGSIKNKVTDSRLSQDNAAIRRRRSCIQCSKRFTTYEQVEDSLPVIVKKDGRQETYSRDKIMQSIRKAVQKRPVPLQKIEDFIERLEAQLQEMGKEIPSSVIGEKVMAALKDWDQVAYVRFASVYREFKDVAQFMDEVRGLVRERHN
ncbi:MAG: transcriptional repressor NrdR [Nitrospirae bacterium]|nr:transcriptional repressor NrdR [Nitrospirota bacterium]